MRSLWLLGTAFILMASVAVPVRAHHSLVGFNSMQPTVLRGVLTDIQWKNPHAWVLMDVKQPDGKIVNWRIDFATPSHLSLLGLRPTMLDLKTTYSFDVWPARDGSPTATGRMLTFPNGQQVDIHDVWGDYMPQANK